MSAFEIFLSLSGTAAICMPAIFIFLSIDFVLRDTLISTDRVSWRLGALAWASLSCRQPRSCPACQAPSWLSARDSACDARGALSFRQARRSHARATRYTRVCRRVPASICKARARPCRRRRLLCPQRGQRRGALRAFFSTARSSSSSGPVRIISIIRVNPKSQGYRRRKSPFCRMNFHAVHVQNRLTDTAAVNIIYWLFSRDAESLEHYHGVNAHEQAELPKV